MIFNTEDSEAHAAARVKSPEAAGVDNKACIEAFQHLLSNSLWTCDILKMCCLRRTHMHTLFSGKGKYSCYLTDCHLLTRLDCTSPEHNFLSSDLRKTDVQDENFVCQNQILCVIYSQMCVIGNTVCVCVHVCVCVCACVCVQMFVVLEEEEGIGHDQVKMFLWVPVFICMAQEFSCFIISFAS